MYGPTVRPAFVTVDSQSLSDICLAFGLSAEPQEGTAYARLNKDAASRRFWHRGSSVKIERSPEQGSDLRHVPSTEPVPVQRLRLPPAPRTPNCPRTQEFGRQGFLDPLLRAPLTRLLSPSVH